METATTPKVILPPRFNETDPDVAAEQKLAYELKHIEDLRTELKDWRNTSRNILLAKANHDQWWKRFDFHGKPIPVEITTVSKREDAEDLADQGIPSWIVEGGKTSFGPHVLFDMVEEAVQFRKREHEQTVDDEEAKASSRLKSVQDMLLTPEIDWLVEGKIHRSGLCQIFGESYAGKTLLVLDLMMSWCAGLDNWQGYKLNNDGEPQDAVYVAAEGGAALSVHVDAWLKYHPEVDRSRLAGLLFLDGGEGDHMFLGIGQGEVDDSDSWTRLKREIIVANLAPTLMVFDTQIDLAPGIEENSNTEMVGVLREVKRLGDTFGFMAIVVHHTGHDGNKARGASGMKAKCDVQAKLTVIGEKSGKAKLEWTKVKGMGLPEDSISYHIQGKKLIENFGSEGAVCVPIGKFQAAIAAQQVAAPTQELQGKIFNALAVNKSLSSRSIAEAIGVGKDNKEYNSGLSWMVDAVMVDKTGKGPQTKYSLSAMAVGPDSY